jgi:hypothetical protein
MGCNAARCGGQPRSTARGVRSLLVDKYVHVKPTRGGQHGTSSEEDCRHERSSEV